MCSILREIYGSCFFSQLHCRCVQDWMQKLYKLVAFYVGYSTRSKWPKYWTFKLSNGYQEFGPLCFGLYFNNNYVYLVGNLAGSQKSLGMPTRQAGNEPNRGVQQEVGSREEGSTRPTIIVAHNSISESAAGDRASAITNTYSPRLTMNKSKSGSKIRKASSLFAQLQKKISSHSDNKK